MAEQLVKNQKRIQIPKRNDWAELCRKERSTLKAQTPAGRHLIYEIIRPDATQETIRRDWRYYRDSLEPQNYWYVLSTLWIKDSRLFPLAEWREYFTAQKSHREYLMCQTEQVMRRMLSRDVTAYRATLPGETDYFNYTLDYDVAELFSLRKRGSVIEAYHIPVGAIIALFLRRNEYEIIVMDRERIRSVEIGRFD